ncbi:MAG TPA: type II secretion system protein [Candidatus Paceibacterota bacterium]|nr:type II secretion system protein [Candidatus Paceibacterota bacterium]
MESAVAFLSIARTPRGNPRRGFTIIELLVVLAIIGILSVIVIVTQSSFNKTLTLANSAYDVALVIRSAETYGLGSRATGVDANAGYGIHLSSSTQDALTLFADTYPGPSDTSCYGLPIEGADAPDAKPGNCADDTVDGGPDEDITTFNLGNGIYFSDFCADVADSWQCVSDDGSTLSSLDIVFSRPNADTRMSINGAYDADFPVTAACIALTSLNGGERFVSVSNAGQITANSASCP